MKLPMLIQRKEHVNIYFKYLFIYNIILFINKIVFFLIDI